MTIVKLVTVNLLSKNVIGLQKSTKQTKNFGGRFISYNLCNRSVPNTLNLFIPINFTH